MGYGRYRRPPVLLFAFFCAAALEIRVNLCYTKTADNTLFSRKVIKYRTACAANRTYDIRASRENGNNYKGKVQCANIKNRFR